MLGDVVSLEDGDGRGVERALRRAAELVESEPLSGGSEDLRLARFVEADHVGDLSILSLYLLRPRSL